MKAILHVDRYWGIGRGNTLMFRLPADMKFFRETTTGNTVLMGKNTFLSFPNGPLKNRTNIVLSSTLEEGEGYILVRNRQELSAILHETKGEVYLIGGASLYEEFFPECSEIFVTKVDADGGADAFVPNLDKDDRFVLSYESEPIEPNGYEIRFCTYRNRSL
ncbi:MAG: dihydrofolate reductase [Christensenellaceae bacterium]